MVEPCGARSEMRYNHVTQRFEAVCLICGRWGSEHDLEGKGKQTKERDSESHDSAEHD